jgi:competence protein ComEC
METQTKNLIKYLILPLSLGLMLVSYYQIKNQPDWLMHINFYDIGQGDSFLVTTYTGNQILIDGGPDDKVVEHLGRDLPFYDKTIEMIVLTHPHLDHVAGLIAVLGKYEVKKVLMPKIEYQSDFYTAFLEAVKDEGSEIIYAVQGQRFFLDQATVLDILYPTTKDTVKPKKSDDINDTSIVAKLTFGKTKMLLTGDAGIEIEAELLPQFDLDVDLLKVGHHGSKHSTSQELLDEVTPKYSVIQVGKNKYGHPSWEVIDRLNLIHSNIFRNDKNSTIEFTSDGLSLTKP